MSTDTLASSHFAIGDSEVPRGEVMCPRSHSQNENELFHRPGLWSDPGLRCSSQVHVQHAAVYTALLRPVSQSIFTLPQKRLSGDSHLHFTDEEAEAQRS